jgi:phosphohistidine phosphatase
MKTYLVQHGKCVSKEENPERPLSTRGIAEIDVMADVLKSIGVSVDLLYHSGKKRAVQTAQLILSKIECDRIGERKGLAPLDDVSDVGGEVQAKKNTLMIVGHLPNLSKLASLLITGNASREVVHFQQGGVLCLEENEKTWAVKWMLVPEILSPADLSV